MKSGLRLIGKRKRTSKKPFYLREKGIKRIIKKFLFLRKKRTLIERATVIAVVIGYSTFLITFFLYINQNSEFRRITKLNQLYFSDRLEDAQFYTKNGYYPEALATINEVLDRIPSLDSVEAYAVLKENEGICYYNLPVEKNSKSNLIKSLLAFQCVLRIKSVEKYPYDNAVIKNRIGEVYLKLSALGDRESNLEKAIGFFNEALQITNEVDYPEEYSEVQNNLGLSYSLLPTTKDEEANLRKSIYAFKEALRYRNRISKPEEYADTQEKLGFAYTLLYLVDKEKENLESAKKCFEEALEIYTQDKFPSEYSMVRSNLEKVNQELVNIERQ